MCPNERGNLNVNGEFAHNDSEGSTDTPQQNKLREQINFHTTRAVQLKQSLNSFNTLISRLPPEILTEIFLLQAAIARKERIALQLDKGDGAIHKSFYDWLNVTRVCHRWRQVALSCTTLWTWVAFEERITEQFLELIIGRARDLPLTLILTFNRPNFHCHTCIDRELFSHRAFQHLCRVKELVPRAREIALFPEKEMMSDAIRGLSDFPAAPMLEVFRIEMAGRSRYQWDWIELPVPQNLFKGETPNLRSLILAGVGLRLPNLLLCPTLRHLEIADCEIYGFLEWLYALGGMQSLEELILDLSVSSSNDEVNPETVSLPNLKLLQMTASLEKFVSHVKYLRFPPSAAVRYTYPRRATHQPDRLSLLQAVIAMLFKDMSAHTVSYGPTRDSTGMLKRGPALCKVWATQHQREPNSQLDAFPLWEQPRLTFQSNAQTWEDNAVSVILLKLDLSHVHTLHVADLMPGRKWARLLKGAKNVSTLRVAGVAALSVPAILAEGVPSDTDEAIMSGEADNWSVGFDYEAEAEDLTMQDARIQLEQIKPTAVTALFPNLTALQVVDIDVPPCQMVSRDVRSKSTPAIVEKKVFRYGFSLRALLKCLKMRAVQGAARITSMEFEGCSDGDLTEIASLAAIFANVFWDGKPLRAASSS